MKAIKAKEIEKKFDEGGDISGHLDLSKARRPDQEQKSGGGAGNRTPDTADMSRML